MIRAKKNDKPLVIDFLSAAFADKKSINYIVRQDERAKFRVRELMDYSFEVCSVSVRFGFPKTVVLASWCNIRIKRKLR